MGGAVYIRFSLKDSCRETFEKGKEIMSVIDLVEAYDSSGRKVGTCEVEGKLRQYKTCMDGHMLMWG